MGFVAEAAIFDQPTATADEFLESSAIRWSFKIPTPGKITKQKKDNSQKYSGIRKESI
jgi:hypothetical protein